MLKIIARVIIVAAALLLIANFVPGIAVASFTTALIAALVWGIMGLTIRPILKLLTLPVTILTFGLFSFVLNALMFWLLAAFVPGFTVAGFVPALEGSLILMIVTWALHAAL
ncbi:MAG TPA: phage holin family protein [Candidatus Paceibacterota bacterium]|nr:phage holin family protein [Candidatus Paceibacterota bacterium]